MKLLLLAGLGPAVKYEDVFAGLALAPGADAATRSRAEGGEVTTWRLKADGRPLLRPRTEQPPNLSAATLLDILDRTDTETTFFDLAGVWKDESGPPADFEVVALSTTFICNRRALGRALNWIAARWPGATLVLGGQYSNLKYAEILRRFSSVRYVVRGDAEDALPKLLEALDGRSSLTDVPNLAWRCPQTEALRQTPITYCDLEAIPSPKFAPGTRIAPYESMRGCPFRCGFCSFPAASPQWRYRSAARIAADFIRYAETGVKHMRAMDSTFTVPGPRLRAFLAMMEAAPLTWECYARANALSDSDVVESFERASCVGLSIGFESMSDRSLRLMNKGVALRHNHRCAELLSLSEIATRVSFMVGYPGETPEDFQQTSIYLAETFPLRFMLSVFSPLDETMPVWNAVEEHRLELLDDNDETPVWRHAGMTSDEADALMRETLATARWRNNIGVHLLWQADWMLPLAPTRSRAENQRIEKLVERHVFAARDHPRRAEQLRRQIADELEGLGIETAGAMHPGHLHG